MKVVVMGWVCAFLACSCPEAESQQLTTQEVAAIQERLEAPPLFLSTQIRVFDFRKTAGRLQFQFELLDYTINGRTTISAFYGIKKDRLLPKLFLILADATGVGIDEIDGTGKVGLCTQTWSFPKSLSSEVTVTVNTKLNNTIFLSRPEPTVIEVCETLAESKEQNNNLPLNWGSAYWGNAPFWMHSAREPADYERFGGRLIIAPESDSGDSGKKTYNYSSIERDFQAKPAVTVRDISPSGSLALSVMAKQPFAKAADAATMFFKQYGIEAKIVRQTDYFFTMQAAEFRDVIVKGENLWERITLYVTSTYSAQDDSLRYLIVADGHFVRAAFKPPLSRYITPIDINYGKQLQEFTDSFGQYIRTALERG
jgi:hypothetical protein